MMATPKRSAKRFSTSSGSADPPDAAVVRFPAMVASCSGVWSPWWVSRPQYIVGTPAKSVTFSASMRSSAAPASNRGMSTSVACRRKPVLRITDWPNAWNSGSAARNTSSPARSNIPSETMAFISMFWWLSSAPLARPVVPLV